MKVSISNFSSQIFSFWNAFCPILLLSFPKALTHNYRCRTKPLMKEQIFFWYFYKKLRFPKKNFCKSRTLIQDIIHYLDIKANLTSFVMVKLHGSCQSAVVLRVWKCLQLSKQSAFVWAVQTTIMSPASPHHWCECSNIWCIVVDSISVAYLLGKSIIKCRAIVILLEVKHVKQFYLMYFFNGHSTH